MSKVNLNPTVDGYRGSIGRLVFKKYRGKTIVCTKPEVTTAPTAGQTAQRERFKEAAAFGVSAMADPMLRAFYEPIAKERQLSVYTVAVTDFLNEPEFQEVDLSAYQGQVGDIIVIRATDDIGLVDVDVKITSQTGAAIESGKAVEIGAGSGKWIYTATTAVATGTDIFIEVNGADHAGTKTQITENPTVGEAE